MAVEAGQTWRLLTDQGSQEYGPVGVRHGLAAGMVGTVREVVPADQPGAFDSTEDAAVLLFDDEQKVIGPDGNAASTPISRAVSFGVSMFDASNPDHIFEEVT